MKKAYLIFLTCSIIAVTSACRNINNNADDVLSEQNQNTDTTITPETDDPAKNDSVQSDKDPNSITTSDKLYPAFETVDSIKKYGYINEEGVFIIAPTFDSAELFSDGRAIITMNDMYQVINEKGEVIYESKHPINTFSNGLAVFRKEDGTEIKMGYIDTNGKIILEPVYLMAEDFKDDKTAMVSTGPNTYSIIDDKGTVKETYTTEDYLNQLDYKDGYKVIYDGDNWNNKGVVNLKYEVIFEPKYIDIFIMGKDLFAIRKQNTEEYTPLDMEPMAIFDCKGNQITDYIFYEVNSFIGDYASASDGQFTYFIDKEGKIAEDLPKVEGVGSLSISDDVIQANVDGELFYLKKDGSVIWRPDTSVKLNDTISAKRIKIRPNRFTLIYYPELEGLENKDIQTSINEQLKKLFKRSPEEIREEYVTYIDDDYSLNLDQDLLIVNKTGYDYPSGAAHGMPIDDFYYFNIKTGTQYTLKDLFKKDILYISKLNSILEKKMQIDAKGEESMFFTDNFYGIDADQHFKLTKESLIIYFYPYEIAAYAAGFPEFEIPYTQLMDVIDTESEFWNSFEHQSGIAESIDPDQDLAEIMDTLICQYERAMTTAVNIDSFDYVEPHLKEESALYKSQKDLVKKLFRQEIYEEYVSSKVEKIEYDQPNNQYLLYVTEEIAIKYPEGERKIKKYAYIYIAVPTIEKNRYQLSEIKKWSK